MQLTNVELSILTDLLSSFHIGVPAVVYNATRNLIYKIYGSDAVNHFSSYVTSSSITYFFISDSPAANDFIREFEKIS